MLAQFETTPVETRRGAFTGDDLAFCGARQARPPASPFPSILLEAVSERISIILQSERHFRDSVSTALFKEAR